MKTKSSGRMSAQVQKEHDRFMAQKPVFYREYSVTPVSHAHQPYYIAEEFLKNGSGMVYWGYNVCGPEGHTNMSPGAVWFHTIEQAKHAIDCIYEAGGHGRDWRDNDWIKTYWELMHTPSTRLRRVLSRMDADGN